MIDNTDTRLRRHLRQWLGRWPAMAPLDVVGSPRRAEPGWDGGIFELLGVGSPTAALLSVPPARAEAVRARAKGIDPNRPDQWHAFLESLPELFDRPDSSVYSGVFRWCERPADLPDAGVWVSAADPYVPAWLRPFGHEVLIAWDPETGGYLAGVGIKHHDPYGREIAVGTEPVAQGRGLGRRLVAQAARRIIDEGAVATYQHALTNTPSARVAEAAGFPNRGWRSFGLFAADQG
jgi:GNAT superfamily N-acetyltransferase